MDAREPTTPDGAGEPAPEPSSDPTPPAAPGLEERLTALQAAVDDGLRRLHQSLERRLALDTVREGSLERLTTQLEAQRGGLRAAATRPLVHGLIKLRDEVSRRAEAFAAHADAAASPALLQALRDVPEDIDALLQTHGVIAFRAPNDRFDPARQSAVVLRRTDRQDLVGTIVRSVRPGFEQGNDLLQKERVEVWVEGPAETRKDLTTPDESPRTTPAAPAQDA